MRPLLEYYTVMTDYKTTEYRKNQPSFANSVDYADDPPVEIPICLNTPSLERLLENLTNYMNAGDAGGIDDTLSDMISFFTKQTPKTSHLKKTNIVRVLLVLSSQNDMFDVKIHSLSCIYILMKNNTDAVDIFIKNEGVILFLSLLDTNAEGLVYLGAQLVSLLFTTPFGRKVCRDTKIIDKLIDFTEYIISNIELIAIEKILDVIILAFDYVFQNINDFTEEHLERITSIFVLCYEKKIFKYLVMSTLDLMKAIFVKVHDPWKFLVESKLLVNCAQCFQQLEPSMQYYMLNNFLFLTSKDDDSGIPIILDYFSSRAFFEYLMNFDRKDMFKNPNFEVGLQVTSNIMFFDPKFIDCTVDTQIFSFISFLLEEGTASIKGYMCAGFFNMLNNMSKDDIIQLFLDPIIIHAFNALQTAKEEHLYSHLITLARSLRNIMSMGIIETKDGYFEEFMRSVPSFMNEIIKNDEKGKLSVIASSILLDYFPEEIPLE